jgi:signal transduction histidine kinase
MHDAGGHGSARRISSVTRKSDPYGSRQRPPVPIDVHDHAAQTLFAIGVLARASLAKIPPALAHGALATALAEVADLAMSGSQRLHQARLVRGGHVPDSLAAAAALRTLVNAFQERTGIEAALVVSGPIVSLPEDVVGILQLAAAEALASIERHPQVGAVVVGLRTSRRGVTLSVQDDGAAPPDIDAPLRDGTDDAEDVGSRARRIGGTIVSSRRDGGNLLRLRVPVKRSTVSSRGPGATQRVLCAC